MVNQQIKSNLKLI